MFIWTRAEGSTSRSMCEAMLYGRRSVVVTRGWRRSVLAAAVAVVVAAVVVAAVAVWWWSAPQRSGGPQQDRRYSRQKTAGRRCEATKLKMGGMKGGVKAGSCFLEGEKGMSHERSVPCSRNSRT